MAHELSRDECYELSVTPPSYYRLPYALFGKWRSFLLDENERARLLLIGDNTGDQSKLFYRHLARITGMDELKMDTVICTEEGIVTIEMAIRDEGYAERIDERHPSVSGGIEPLRPMLRAVQESPQSEK